MEEEWVQVRNFENYSVSSYGRIRNDDSGRIIAISQNQSGLAQVGMMRNGTQDHRSVPRLVAKAFVENPYLKIYKTTKFDTPINLDGDRLNNHADNLVWRPRWFAYMYHRQFVDRFEGGFPNQVRDLETGEISENSWACATRYGLLEKDLVLSVLNRTYVYPTYQEFRMIPSFNE